MSKVVAVSSAAQEALDLLAKWHKLEADIRALVEENQELRGQRDFIADIGRAAHKDLRGRITMLEQENQQLREDRDVQDEIQRKVSAEMLNVEQRAEALQAERDALIGRLPTEQPYDETGKERLLLNVYGRRCYAAGEKSERAAILARIEGLTDEMRSTAEDIENMSDPENNNAQQAAVDLKKWATSLDALRRKE